MGSYNGTMAQEIDLEPIFARHDLPQIAATINRQLEQERLAREAFRRDLTPSVKAEFIGGKVVMHSPAKAKHLRATKRLMNLLQNYVQLRRLGEVFTEKALVTLTRNDYEPDICFFNQSKAAAFDDNQMTFPAPDLIVEVLSDSTESRDRGVKFDDYAVHGVAEYWIVDCDDQSIEQYELRAGETTYRLRHKSSEGEIESKAIAGFRIPIASVFDDAINQATLQRLVTAE